MTNLLLLFRILFISLRHGRLNELARKSLGFLFLLLAVASIPFIELQFMHHAALESQPYSHWPPKGVYNVMDWNAKGDGVTDDTNAIQTVETAAENATSNCGGGSGHCGAELLFPCGNYIIGQGPITLSGGSAGTGGITWRSMCGPITYGESATYSGATLINNNPADPAATITFAGGGTPTINWTANNLHFGQPVWFSNSGGALPAAVTAGTEYFVLAQTTNTITVSASFNGIAINFATAGTGTQTGHLFTDLVWANAGTTLDQLGPAFFDLGFVGKSRTGNCIHVTNFLHFNFEHSTARDCGVGIFFDTVNTQDNSDATIHESVFRNNVIGIDCATSTNGACNSRYQDNHFIVNNSGDIGVRCQAGGAQLTILNNKFDANATPTMGAAIDTSCFHTIITGNSSENPQPFVVVRGGTSNNGRGTTITGNNVISAGGTVGTLTCSTHTSTTVDTCSGGTLSTTASLLAGMQLKAASGVPTPFVYGSGAPPALASANILSGAVKIASVTNSTSFVMSEAATASAAVLFTFCWPVYDFPSTWPNTAGYQVIVTGNNYANAGGCGATANWGNDGG